MQNLLKIPFFQNVFILFFKVFIDFFYRYNYPRHFIYIAYRKKYIFFYKEFSV